MCIAFKLQDVLDYVLGGNEETKGLPSVSRQELALFCGELEKRIASHQGTSPHYRYVYYDFDLREKLDLSVIPNGRYLSFENRVRFAGSPDPTVGSAVESRRNDDVVVSAMRSALRVLSEAGTRAVAS